MNQRNIDETLFIQQVVDELQLVVVLHFLLSLTKLLRALFKFVDAWRAEAICGLGT